MQGGEPARLIVDPKRVKNRVWHHVKVLDEAGRGVPGAVLSILDSEKDGLVRKHADQFGELLYTIELEEEKEREIVIAVAGYGQGAFRRTWRGRRE